MKIFEVLTNARDLISKEEKWHQGFYCNEDRTCFCALGALAVASNKNYSAINGSVFDKLLKSAVGLGDDTLSFAHYNDSHTHAEVISAFDKAIELAIEQEKSE